MEDFTTELFAAVLEENPEIKKHYIENFLKLPVGNYELYTQKSYKREGAQDSVIDMVLVNESKKTLVFIENKVNSKEGFKQLNRYLEILDTYSERGYTTHLYYCTKFSDPKNPRDNFSQYRWYELARFLKRVIENEKVSNLYVSEFLKYLNQKNMAQDLTITSGDIATLKKLKQTLAKTRQYLAMAGEPFEKAFRTKLKTTRQDTQIKKHNRVFRWIEGVVKGTGYSELGFGIAFHDSTFLFTQIYIERSNPLHDWLVDKADKNSEFGLIDFGKGTSIGLREDLSSFMDNENTEYEIVNWYKDSFAKFKDFISDAGSDNFTI